MATPTTTPATAGVVKGRSDLPAVFSELAEAVTLQTAKWVSFEGGI
jgi:hypothetical protein